jgi:hypothetical protein
MIYNTRKLKLKARRKDSDKSKIKGMTEYKIVEILAKRIRNGVAEVQVQWAVTWEIVDETIMKGELWQDFVEEEKRIEAEEAAEKKKIDAVVEAPGKKKIDAVVEAPGKKKIDTVVEALGKETVSEVAVVQGATSANNEDGKGVEECLGRRRVRVKRV